ncbi:MAG TPA: DUF1467 family protein [Beijerinckiaceae bacterium]|nr:DUF1467 family protein [Beijerinckiaceae bacterium]
MKVTTWFAVYFVIWWLTLFTVLPFAARRKLEVEPVAGADPGAPPKPNFVAIMLATTLVAAVVFAIVWWFIENGYV